MKLGQYIGSASDFLETRSVPGLVSPNHNVGVEIELENFRYDFSGDSPATPRMTYFLDVTAIPKKIGLHWDIVRDNSLRRGAEFIFKGPRKGVGIIEAMKEMQAFLDSYSRLDKPAVASDRCSVHVHCDVRDMEEFHLNRLIQVYILVEKVLFCYVSPKRLKNNYCRPVTDSQFKVIMADISAKALPGEFSDAISRIRTQCDKYSALNLLPIQHYGTVEFRHHQGTTSTQEILDWINIILAIKLSAYIDHEKLMTTYKFHGYKALLNLIFEGTAISGEFLDRPDVEMATRKGMNDYMELMNYNSLKDVSSFKPIVSAVNANKYIKTMRELLGINEGKKTKRVINTEMMSIEEYLNHMNAIYSPGPVDPTNNSTLTHTFEQVFGDMHLTPVGQVEESITESDDEVEGGE